MLERRKHKRFPVIKDLAEPIELAILSSPSKEPITIPGVLTNFSAGGMDLVLLGKLPKDPHVKLSFHLPGFDRFDVEAQVVWTRPKETTEIVGLKFTKINPDHVRHINHMAEAYWECETRIKEKAPTICFKGCTYWDLCEKTEKLKNGRKKKGPSLN